MGEMGCLDSTQLAAIVGGTIFATLTLCAGASLIVWYLLVNDHRNNRFAKKMPRLQKFLTTKLPQMRRHPTKNGEKISPTKVAKTQNSKVASTGIDQVDTTLQQQIQQRKEDKQQSPVKQQTPTAASCRDSMEEISLDISTSTTTTPDDIRLIKRMASKLSQSEREPTVVDSIANNQSPVIMKTPKCENELNMLSLASDLSPEQRSVLDANRQRLEAERQQMRQLGIL